MCLFFPTLELSAYIWKPVRKAFHCRHDCSTDVLKVPQTSPLKCEDYFEKLRNKLFEE